MLQKIIRKIKNTKGFTSIEVAISVIILLIVISGFTDLTTILKKQTTLSSANTYVARTVGLQGGVRINEPQQFEGYNYVSSQKLYKNLNTMFKDSGVSENDWVCEINGYKLTPTLNMPLIDFGDKLRIKMKVKYTWGLVSNFIPGRINGVRESERIITSSYKIRNGGFNSSLKLS